MASVAAALRRAHQALIAQNPVEITISRTTLASNNAGGYAAPVAVPQASPITARVYEEQPLQNGSRVETDLPGQVQREKRWGLLAPDTADLKADPQTMDEFTLVGMGHFRLTSVVPKRHAGELYGYQAELEKVA